MNDYCDTTTGCCCCGTSPQRRYLTRSEEIENLKAYKKALQNEIQGIEEHLNKLES